MWIQERDLSPWQLGVADLRSYLDRNADAVSTGTTMIVLEGKEVHLPKLWADLFDYWNRVGSNVVVSPWIQDEDPVPLDLVELRKLRRDRAQSRRAFDAEMRAILGVNNHVPTFVYPHFGRSHSSNRKPTIWSVLPEPHGDDTPTRPSLPARPRDSLLQFVLLDPLGEAADGAWQEQIDRLVRSAAPFMLFAVVPPDTIEMPSAAHGAEIHQLLVENHENDLYERGLGIWHAMETFWLGQRLSRPALPQPAPTTSYPLHWPTEDVEQEVLATTEHNARLLRARFDGPSPDAEYKTYTALSKEAASSPSRTHWCVIPPGDPADEATRVQPLRPVNSSAREELGLERLPQMYPLQVTNACLPQPGSMPQRRWMGVGVACPDREAAPERADVLFLVAVVPEENKKLKIAAEVEGLEFTLKRSLAQDSMGRVPQVCVVKESDGKKLLSDLRERARAIFARVGSRDRAPVFDLFIGAEADWRDEGQALCPQSAGPFLARAVWATLNEAGGLGRGALLGYCDSSMYPLGCCGDAGQFIRDQGGLWAVGCDGRIDDEIMLQFDHGFLSALYSRCVMTAFERGWNRAEAHRKERLRVTRSAVDGRAVPTLDNTTARLVLALRSGHLPACSCRPTPSTESSP